MRILVVDIDTLRADHLGCYGYHRDTTPTIDAIAAEGVRFGRVHSSDVPCGPARSAWATGQVGSVNGVIGHGGTAGDLRYEGAERGFAWRWMNRSWAMRLRQAGYRTATVSSFAERHSAYQWHMGMLDAINPGLLGMENADLVGDLARGWLDQHGREDRWMLHVHLWDPHAPYRVPESFGEPFEGDPVPAWMTEEVREAQWGLPGPHSAQEVLGFGLGDQEIESSGLLPRQPTAMRSMDDVRRLFDGYDTGIRYADAELARIMDHLDTLGVAEETAVWVTADHGEAFGEAGTWCDHHGADAATAHVPGVLRWPGLEPRVEHGLRWHLDLAATVAELAGAHPSRRWDGVSVAEDLRAGRPVPGRDHVVITQGAWTAQRGVRFDDDRLYLATRHDGFHGWPAEQVFDLSSDPHQQHDLAGSATGEVDRGRDALGSWLEGVRQRVGDDRMDTVMDEGGPWHVRGQLPSYAQRLRETGRGAWADWFEHRPDPVGGPD